ncbi:MAG: TrbC/VirB2 family protein [Candidatus Pacebacteria bacterium]|jgi:type IV secretory pathway VirB2 component (pilin)|nr:TrbC/VirB2 family protein [Candidatus Paceibacterota bacterium]
MKKLLILGFMVFATTSFALAQALPGEDGNEPTVGGFTTPNSFESSGGINEPKPSGGINDGPRNQVLPKISNPLKAEFSDIPSLVNGLVKIALQLGTIAAVLALVWVGFKFILAQGNPTEIAKARQALGWVIIGIAILFGAQIIVEIIKGTLSDFVDPAKIKF